MFEWITSLLARGGYFAFGWLMFLETVFPPIPSEVLVPLGGFLAAEGTFNLIAVIVIGTVCSSLGAFLWYRIGWRLGEKRIRKLAAKYGRWMAITPRDVDRTGQWFRKRGLWAVFLARMLPGPRTMISVPAGMARMRFLPFALATLAGTGIWISFLAITGYVLQSQYERVTQYLDPILWVMIALALGWYVWRVIKLSR